MPQHSMTPWMPWKVGTTTDSSSVSSKPPRLANPGVVVASTARKKVTTGINARRPSPQSSKNCPISKTGVRGAEEKVFKPQGGCGSEGRPCPYTLSGSQPGAAPGARGPCPVDDASAGGSPYKYWNEDALSRWLGLENLGWAILDSIQTRVLVDNGARVNSVMPAYVC